MSLYPQTQSNPALAKNVVKMLDTAIGSELAESNMLGAQPTFQVSSYDDFNTAFEVEMIIDNNNAGFFSYQYFPETNDVENDVDIHSDQFRGQGYGKLLLLKAIETAQEHNLPFKVDRNGVTPAQGNVYRSLVADKIIRINPDKTIVATGRSLPGSDMSENQGWAATLEARDKKCPPATQDITINLKNRQKAIDEYGYGPLNPDMPNTKFWMKKVDEWNLDSMEEAQQSLCGNCAAFDIRQDTLDCIAQGIDADSPEDAEGVIDAGDLGYCKFLKFKCASRRTCDAWVTGGPLVDKNLAEIDAQNSVGGMTASYQQRENQPIDEDYIDEKWSQKYKSSINCASPKGFSQRAHCAGRKK
jgi:hypothetical protein